MIKYYWIKIKQIYFQTFKIILLFTYKTQINHQIVLMVKLILSSFRLLKAQQGYYLK